MRIKNGQIISIMYLLSSLGSRAMLASRVLGEMLVSSLASSHENVFGRGTHSTLMRGEEYCS